MIQSLENYSYALTFAIKYHGYISSDIFYRNTALGLQCLESQISDTLLYLVSKHDLAGVGAFLFRVIRQVVDKLSFNVSMNLIMN